MSVPFKATENNYTWQFEKRYKILFVVVLGLVVCLRREAARSQIMAERGCRPLLLLYVRNSVLVCVCRAPVVCFVAALCSTAVDTARSLSAVLFYRGLLQCHSPSSSPHPYGHSTTAMHVYDVHPSLGRDRGGRDVPTPARARDHVEVSLVWGVFKTAKYTYVLYAVVRGCSTQNCESSRHSEKQYHQHSQVSALTTLLRFSRRSNTLVCL